MYHAKVSYLDVSVTRSTSIRYLVGVGFESRYKITSLPKTLKMVPRAAMSGAKQK